MGATGTVAGGAGKGGAPGVHQRVSGRSCSAGAHGGDDAGGRWGLDPLTGGLVGGGTAAVSVMVEGVGAQGCRTVVQERPLDGGT